MAGRLGSRVWVLSLPVMFAELSETIIHVIDTAFLGRVGDTELAALVLADTILGLWLVGALGLTDALQIVIARRYGEDDTDRAGQAFAQGAFVTLALSVVLTVALKVASPWLSDLVAASSDVSEAVDDFLQIAAFGIPFLCLSFAYGSFFIGIGRTYVVAFATAVLTVVNLVLGYALILGNLSLPELGLRGAAYASVGAEMATILFLVGYSIGAGYDRRYRLLQAGGWEKGVTWTLIGLAGPVVVYGIVEGFQWLFFFIILEQLGTEVLALSNVIYACLLVFLIPAEASSETAVSMVSAAIGGGDQQRVREVLRKVMRVAAAVTLPIGLFAVALPGAIFSIFFGISDPGASAELALRIVAGGMVVAVPWLVWMGGLQGTGDTAASSVIDSGVSVVILAWAWVAGMVLDGGLAAVWSGPAVAWSLGLIAAVAWMRSDRWQRVRV